MDALPLLVLACVAVTVLASRGVQVLSEFEVGVVFRGDRLTGVREPGLRMIVPFVDRMLRVSLRPIEFDTPEHELRTVDGKRLRVGARVHFQVDDPVRVALQGNYLAETWKELQEGIAGAIAGVSAAEATKDPETLGQGICERINGETQRFGVHVSVVRLALGDLNSVD